MRSWGIYCVIIMTCLQVGRVSADDKVVRLHTNLQPPYTVKIDDELRGEVPAKLNCVMKRLQRELKLSIAPRKRNRVLLRSQEIDGFLLSIPDPALDKVGMATAPIVLEQWHFFWRLGARLPAWPTDQRVGTVRGSNESIWSRKQPWQTYEYIPEVHSLVLSLQSKRIDYALADEQAFKVAAYNTGDLSYGSTFARYVPLVAYFTNDFVNRNPGFIEQFNLALGRCVTRSQAVQAKEKQKILRKAKSLLDPHIINLVRTYRNMPHDSLSVTERQFEDKAWTRAMYYGMRTFYMNEILQNDLSKFLQKITAHDSRVTEVFVMDQNGYVVGASVPTSDYYQGDELKFSIIRSENTGNYVSDLMYDHSTRRFQIQVSLPLYLDAENEHVSGVITIGYDADNALSVLPAYPMVQE